MTLRQTAVIWACGLTLLVGGCASTPKEREKLYTDVNPSTRPVHNQTPLAEALGCFDNMLRSHRVEPIYVASVGFPSLVGPSFTLASGEQMIVTAIAQLRSDVFRFVPLTQLARQTPGIQRQDINPLDHGAIIAHLQFIQELYKDSAHPPTMAMPDYVISGAFSQHDEKIHDEKQSAGLELVKHADLAYSQDELNSTLSSDMYAWDFKRLVVKSRAAAQDSVLVTRRGKAANIGGSFSALGLGLFFDTSFDQSEGLGQAARTLIELGLLQVLGELAHVPYQQCLQQLSGNPAAPPGQSQAYGAGDGEENSRLVPPRPNQPPDSEGGRPDYSASANGIPSAKPPLSLRLEDGNGGRAYRVGDKLRFTVSAGEDAYMHCFLQTPKRELYRIFPHQHHAGDRLQAGQPLTLPDTAVNIVFDQVTDQERVGCVASRQPLRSGWNMPLDASVARPLPVGDLSEIRAEYGRRQAEAVVLEQLEITVR